MEVKGKVIAVLPLVSGEGRNGTWKRQEYVIEHDPNTQYPRKMKFDVWGDKVDQFNIQEGQLLRINFDIDCHEYQGRWYNVIRAWKVEPDDSLPVKESDFTPIDSFAPPPPSSPIDEGSDLPF